MTISITNNAKNVLENRYLFQYIATALGLLNVLSVGMFYGWPSSALPQLQAENSSIPTTNSEGSWIAVMQLIGAIFGDFLAIPLLDYVGRKVTIIITSIPFVAAWVIIGFANTVVDLYVARFIAGIGDALIYASIPVYIGEIAHPNIRGRLGGGIVVTGTLGMLIINSFDFLQLDIHMGAFVASVIPALAGITFFFMPETPYYFLMKNNPEKAKQSLRLFRQKFDVDEEFNIIQDAIKQQNENTGKFIELFKNPVSRKSFFVIGGLRTLQQFSGSMAILFYASLIFKRAGGLDPKISTLIYFLVQLTTNMFSSYLLDKIGRKRLLLISLVGSSICLTMEAVYFYLSALNYDLSNYNLLPLLGLIGYVVMYGIGLSTVPITMLGELFTTNVKAFAVALSDLYLCFACIAVTKFFQIMQDNFDIYIAFFVFALDCIIGIIFVVLYVPETKGISLEKIQMKLQQN